METRTTPMSDVGILPRVLLHKTQWGTAILWVKGQGLLARDERGQCRRMTPDELRQQFPLAWPAWVRWVVLLPPDELLSSRSGPCGGAAA
jgi:hypothetical protein